MEILNNYEEFQDYDIISDFNINEETDELVIDENKKKHILFFSMQKIINEKKGLTVGAYMGIIMGKYRGKVDGKKVMMILNKLLK